jgi:DNA-binding SARP family transcriptional activator/tetratricopeptide (TPR) repeat protein
MDPGVPDTAALAALVRGLRQGAALTQRELAGRAGLSLGSIRNLEQGRTHRPGPGSLRALAAALSLSPAQAGDLERAASGRGVWLQVLGPLAAWRDGVAVPLGGPAQRAALGLLAVSPGALVHRAAIIDVLWPDSPPANAVNLVQAHVSRLRKMLAARRVPDQDGLLSSAGASYRLRAGPGQLDLARFGQLIADARAACARADYQGGCGLYQLALELWRGEPLADVDLLRGYPEVTGLARRRADTVVEYARVASAAGWHDRVLALLRELAGREPLHEQAHAQLMIALAGCGQQAEALAVYHDLRRRLDDELGMPPGPEVAEAHQLVLRQDIPAPATPATPAPGAAARRMVTRLEVPRQLPAAPPFFTGRAGELAALAQMLDQAGGSTPETVVISAIGGTAGVGKTALAIHWAHQMAERYPDGQLYADLRGFDPSGRPVTPDQVIRGFLDALGVAANRIPPGLDAQAGLYRSLLAGRHMLIVLDNARDEQQVRPLLPGTPRCLVVVTSRRQLAGLAASNDAGLITLDVLTAVEARRLLTARLGTGRVAAEPDAVTEIADLCAFLPLALAVAAARAAARPRRPLATLAAELRTTTGRLDALDTADPAASIRAVFSWSYQQLSPQAARLFRLLGLHPGPDITIAAAASLAGISPRQAGQTLDKLTQAHLIAEHSPGRYAFHDLLRAYAASQAHDPEPDRNAAVGRILDHYLHTACHSRVLLRRPQQEPLALAPPSPGTRPERPAGHRQALAWFNAEHQVLLAAVTVAAETGADRRAWQLPCAMADYYRRRGFPYEQVTVMTSALAAATRLGDALGQAMSLRRLGLACYSTGYYDQARAHLEYCLPLYQQLGDRKGEAVTQQNLAYVADAQGRYADALRHNELARGLFQAIGHGLAEAETLGNVGWGHALLGDYELARQCCEQALALAARLGGGTFEHAIWDTLGYIAHHLGNFALAAAHFESALSLSRDHSDLLIEASILNHLGDARHAAGEMPQARQAWQQALAIYDDIQHPDAGQLRDKLAHPAASPQLPGRSGS